MIWPVLFTVLACGFALVGRLSRRLTLAPYIAASLDEHTVRLRAVTLRVGRYACYTAAAMLVLLAAVLLAALRMSRHFSPQELGQVTPADDQPAITRVLPVRATVGPTRTPLQPGPRGGAQLLGRRTAHRGAASTSSVNAYRACWAGAGLSGGIGKSGRDRKVAIEARAVPRSWVSMFRRGVRPDCMGSATNEWLVGNTGAVGARWSR